MILSRLLLLGSAGLAVTAAGPGHKEAKRDLATIQTALKGINTALASLDSAIAKDDVGLSLVQEAMGVIRAIQSATSEVQASQNLNATDTNNLIATTDSLTSNVNVTISDLIKEKPVFQRRGTVRPVLQAMQTIKSSAVQLAETLASRVPPELSVVAATGVNNLVRALDRGISVYDGSSPEIQPAPAAAASAPPPPPPPAPPAASSSVLSQVTVTVTGAPTLVAASTVTVTTVTIPAPQTLSTSTAPPQPTSTLGGSTLSESTPSGSTLGESYGGKAVNMVVAGTFVPGQTCQCMCPA